jgi:hypothetical protein
MIFRAETDKATRPIGELTRDVKTLRSALEDQIKTAERGEVSLDKLATTTRDLKKAQEELGTARSLLTSLNGQVSALEKAEQKLEAASAKYNDLKNQVDAAEKPTKRLTNSMEAAGRAQSAAAESVERIGAEVAQTRAQIEGIIGPVTNFGESFKTIADTSREIARGLAVAGAASDDFKAKLAALDAQQSKTNADASFQKQGQDAGLLQSQIDYISQFENRVELLNQAKRELTQQNAAFDQALRAQEAKEGADNVNRLRAAFEATAAEQQRIEQVNAFRTIAADANAAATDVSRFGTTADTTSASATRLADAILAITAPASAANQSIDGLEESVKQAASILDGEGNRSLQQYNVAMGELAAANAAAMRIAKDVDGYRTQQEALARSTAAFQAAQAEVKRLAADLATADTPTDEMAKALSRAEAALEAAGREMQRDGNLAEQMGGKLRKAGVDVNDLTQAEQRLTQAAKEAAAAQNEIAGKTGGASTPFGFSLQDMQNLGYQVNDLITQVASGTPITQAFAQQFGQIYQIPAMQNLIARFAVFIPLVAAAAVAVGTLAAAISRAGDRAEALKSAEAYIARIGDGGDITAQQMANASIALQDFGVSAEDAMTILQNLNEAGLDPQYIDAFTVAIKNASDATGVEMPEAAQLLTDALSGGYDQVVKLDEQFNFLTVSEREHIRAMYDSGQESEARRIVFDRFYASMDEGASKMNGPWKNAVDNFKGAFRSFLDYLGSTTVVKDFIADVNNALVGLNYLLLRARGFSHEQAGNAAVNGQGRAPQAPQRPQGDPRGGRTTGPTKEGQDAIADAQRELKARKLLTREERLRNAEIEARRKAPSGASDEERDQLAALARQKESNALAEEGRKKGASAAKKAQSERDKAAREAAALQNRIESAEESLQSGLDGMDAKVAKVATGGITEALANASTAVDKQYDRLYRKLDDFAKLTQGKGTIGGLTIDAYRAQLDANKTILTQQAQLKVYEDQVNDVLNQRKQLLADIEERANRGAITSAQAIKESSEVTSRLNPVIQQLAGAAGQFATSIAGATPSPELQAFLDKMERISGQAQQGPMQSDVAKTANTRLGAEEAKLNQIIAERNNLISANNTLVELGLKTQADAQRDTAAAFATSQPMIAEQVRVIQQTLDLMRQLGVIQPQVYDAWIAKLQAVTAQSTYTNENVLKLNNLVQNQLLQGGMNMFDSFAKGLAGLATGTMSVGDAFNGLLDTFLNFAATFLAEIAKMIIQALILKAIQSALGLPGGGGGLGGFFFHSGTGPGGVGGGSSRRTRSSFDLHPSMLAAVPRYHEGTQGAGLKNNEMVAVLERGEKVLTEEQQRAEAKRAAGSGESATGLRQVLAFGDDQVAAAMQGMAGEKVTVTHLRRNVPLIKQLLKD